MRRERLQIEKLKRAIPVKLHRTISYLENETGKSWQSLDGVNMDEKEKKNIKNFMKSKYYFNEKMKKEKRNQLIH